MLNGIISMFSVEIVMCYMRIFNVYNARLYVAGLILRRLKVLSQDTWLVIYSTPEPVTLAPNDVCDVRRPVSLPWRRNWPGAASLNHVAAVEIGHLQGQTVSAEYDRRGWPLMFSCNVYWYIVGYILIWCILMCTTDIIPNGCDNMMYR